MKRNTQPYPRVRRLNSGVSNSARGTRGEESQGDRNVEFSTDEYTNRNAMANSSVTREELKNMLESYMLSVNMTVKTSLDTQRTAMEQREEVSRIKYQKLLEKYNALKELRQSEFNRHCEIVASYQSIVVKMCTKLIRNTNQVFDKEEVEVLGRILDSLSDEKKPSKQPEDHHDDSDDDQVYISEPQHTSRITNPIVGRRNDNPIHKIDNNKLYGGFDSNLKQILDT